MSVPRPFLNFNFDVTISPRNRAAIRAGFSECDGLEMSMKHTPMREGGNNGRVFNLPGPVEYGTLTLRRGMGEAKTLWDWFESAQESFTLGKASLLAEIQVTVWSADLKTKTEFQLVNCLPVKVKAPALNAIGNSVAIEELQIAYELLKRV